MEDVVTTAAPDTPGIIVAKIGNLSARIRQSDGFVDATTLALEAGKQIGHWNNQKGED